MKQPERELPAAHEDDLPIHFNAANACRWDYEADPAALRKSAAEWAGRRSGNARRVGIPRVRLLLIDVQRDFCLPQGSLFVGGASGNGAVDDSVGICRFLYRNLLSISEVVCTLDTHLPHQIFFASFWRTADGADVFPGREISAGELEASELAPRPGLADWLCGGDEEWLSAQVLDYCRRLEAGGRYRLFLWPEHCLLGSTGHSLVGVIQEARLFHSYVLGARAALVNKGSDALTESYSVFQSEVRETFDGRPLGERKQVLLDELLAQDLVVVAGQAASHCVRASLDDLLAEAQRRDAELAHKLVVLEDCMSPVVLRDPENENRVTADFSDQADEALERYRAAGMQIGRSDQRVEDWL